MANEQNLIPQAHKLTVEEQSKGGINSGKSKQRQKTLRELAQAWLETEVTKDKNGEPMTGGQFMLAVAAKEIAKGNSKFWELMRDTAGQKPVDKVMIADVEQSVIEEVEKAVLDDDPSTGD